MLGVSIAKGSSVAGHLLVGKAAIDAGYGVVKINEIEREYKLRS